MHGSTFVTALFLESKVEGWVYDGELVHHCWDYYIASSITELVREWSRTARRGDLFVVIWRSWVTGPTLG